MAYQFPDGVPIGTQEIVGDIVFQYDGDDAEGNPIWNIVPGATAGFDPDADWNTTGNWYNTGSWIHDLSAGVPFIAADTDGVAQPTYGAVIYDQNIQMGAENIFFTARFDEPDCGAGAYGFGFLPDFAVFGHGYADVNISSSSYASKPPLPYGSTPDDGDLNLLTNTDEPDGGYVKANGGILTYVEITDYPEGTVTVTKDSRGKILKVEQEGVASVAGTVLEEFTLPEQWSNFGVDVLTDTIYGEANFQDAGSAGVIGVPNIAIGAYYFPGAAVDENTDFSVGAYEGIGGVLIAADIRFKFTVYLA